VLTYDKVYGKNRSNGGSDHKKVGKIVYDTVIVGEVLKKRLPRTPRKGRLGDLK